MIKLSNQMLDRLLAPYGLNNSTVTYLGGGREDSDGIVYSYESCGKPMTVKLMAWKEPESAFARTRRRYEERIRFAFYLGEGGASVVNPMRDADGMLYRFDYSDGYGYVTYLMERACGSEPGPELWDARLLGLWGAAVGRMHALAARYPDWRCSPETDSDGKPLLGWRNEVAGFRGWCRDTDVKRKWDDMEAALAALPVERESFGFIHNDPHDHNILWDGETLRVIDFDVANYHWFMTDISIALQSTLFSRGGMERPVEDRDAIRRFLDGFMAGYEREYHIDVCWLGHLGLFIRYRSMLLFTVMQDWLDTNDAMKTSWKRMILDGADLLL